MSPIRPRVTVVGRRMDDEAHRIRGFLTRVAQPYERLEAGAAQAAELLAAHGLTDADLPLVVEQQRVLRNVTVAGLAEAWGSTTLRRSRTTTSRSSARGPRAWRRRCTRHRTA